MSESSSYSSHSGWRKVGVLVERHLGVEGVHLALGREDERVDFGQVAVALDVAGVEPHQQRRRLGARLGVELGPVDPLPGRLLGEPLDRVDVDAGDGVGVGLRHLLDLHSALGRQHAEVQLGRTVEGEAGVVLLGDVRGVLYPEPLDHVALDVESQDVAGVQAHLVGVGGQLHPARLAAAAHLHLGLDHHRVARRLGLLDGLVHRVGHAPRRGRDAEAGEVLLALVLVEVHFGCFLLCRWFGVAFGCGADGRVMLGATDGARRRDQASTASSRASRVSANQCPMDSSGAPGVKTAATPWSLSTGMSASGMMPPDDDEHVLAPGVGQQLDHLGHQGEVGPREQGEPDGVGVLLDHRLDHLFGRLVQAGVDHLEAAVAQRSGDHLGPPVVAIEPRLGHDHPVGTFHDPLRIRTPRSGRQTGPNRANLGAGDWAESSASRAGNWSRSAPFPCGQAGGRPRKPARTKPRTSPSVAGRTPGAADSVDVGELLTPRVQPQREATGQKDSSGELEQKSHWHLRSLQPEEKACHAAWLLFVLF